MTTLFSKNNKQVVIRGSGDIATGIAVRLYNCGYQVIMTDITLPTMIRCSVSFGQCLYGDSTTVEGITAIKATTLEDVADILAKQQIPVIIDADLSITKALNANYLVDAILAKCNLGTQKTMAPITIALGPGFEAGKDCHALIETSRGHYLGRVIYAGCTLPNSGIPGNIAGYTYERVVRSPCAGQVQRLSKIGDIVKQGDIIAKVDSMPVYAPLSGMVRGLINDGLSVENDFKIADIDPRGEKADYTTVSDKARAIGGSVLEAMLHLALQYD
jgi:xanthine dehydrogenase accessory factor